MCGRYVSPEEAAIERFWLIHRDNPNPFKARFNVAPTTTIPMLMHGDEGNLELHAARWGLVPHWWSKDKPPPLTFNARSEEAAGKPMWRHAYRKSRCLIPARGWYEWKQVEQVDTRTGEVKPAKQPHYIYAPDDEVFAFAGLLSHYKGANNEPLLSCSILTKAAVPSVSDVHDRTPVVLKATQHREWCDRSVVDPEHVAAMVDAASADFVLHPVSTKVNNARNESPDLIEPVAA